MSSWKVLLSSCWQVLMWPTVGTCPGCLPVPDTTLLFLGFLVCFSWWTSLVTFPILVLCPRTCREWYCHVSRMSSTQASRGNPWEGDSKAIRGCKPRRRAGWGHLVLQGCKQGFLPISSYQLEETAPATVSLQRYVPWTWVLWLCSCYLSQRITG